MIGVYKITNSITNEFYVGSSKNVQRRWREHRKLSRWNKHPNSKLYVDMKKYGTDKFVFEVIEEVVDVTKLKSREQYYIEQYQPGYNQNTAYTGLDTTDMVEYRKQYYNQLCRYEGEYLTLNALIKRFRRAGIEHPMIEAKKYKVIYNGE